MAKEETSEQLNTKIKYVNPLRYGLFGPAIILLAFGQATGELVHWPNLVIKYGVFFLFILIPACVIQFPIFGFLARHTVLSGESHLSQLLKINKIYAIFVWIIFILTSIWISSYTSSGGVSLAKLYGAITKQAVDLNEAAKYSALIINTIFFVVLLLLRGRTYKFLKTFMHSIAALSFVTITIMFLYIISVEGLNIGIIGSVFNFKFSLPETWVAADTKLLISAFVFAGLGGLWNVLYSVWLRQDGMGLAADNKSEFLEYRNELIDISEDEDSVRDYNKTMHILKRDLWIGLSGNFIMILLIVYIALVTLPAGMQPPSGIGVITALGDAVSYYSIWLAGIFYIFIGIFLLDTWATAADSLSKMHANMIIGIKNTGKISQPSENESYAKLYYIGFLIVMLIMTFVSSLINRPQQLNYLNGLLSMFGSVLLIIGIYLIEKNYRKSLRKFNKHKIMYAFLGIAFVVYSSLSVAYVFYVQ